MIDMSIFMLLSEVNPEVFPFVIPQGVGYPCLVYSQIWDFPYHTHDGRANYRRASYQVDCFDREVAAGERLGDAVRRKMEGAEGVVGDVEIASITVSGWYAEMEPDRTGEVFRVRITFDVEYFEID